MRAFFLVCLLFSLTAEAKVSQAYQFYTRGVELASKKKWEDSLAKFQSAIDLNPNFIASYIEWARSAVMLKRRKDGLNKLSTALAFVRTEAERKKVSEERNSLSEIFYTNEAFQKYQNGLNYISLQQGRSALDALEKAKVLEPDNVLVLNAYAKALQEEERNAEAVEILEAAFLLNEGNRAVRLDLAEGIMAKDPSRASHILKPLLLGAADERVHWLQAQSLSAQKKNKEAIEFLKDSVDRNSHWIFAPFWLGKLYAQESNGAWNARKYLMTFLRRASAKGPKSVLSLADERRLEAAKAEADDLLAKVNQALE